MPASSRILSCNHGILSSTSYLPAARFCFPQEAPLFVENRSDSFQAIPHNSKCRYGERGAADAKPKAQIILAFWQRRCRAAAAGAVLKPSGGNCAVLPSLFPVVTRSAFLFLPTNCPCSRKVYRNFQLFHALFIRSSFLFFMIESIGGPYYRPQLEELLCTKPNSRATPKRRPALYMP